MEQRVCVWVEGDGTRTKWCLETLKVIGSEAAALKIKCYASPRRWQALIMAAAAGGGRLEVRRAVFLRATPAFCASLRIVPYALSE